MSSAFKKLDSIYGTWKSGSTEKTNYNLPMSKMTNSDLSRLLRSQEIVRSLKKPQKNPHKKIQKKNPLKNIRLMQKLNPYAVVQKRNAILTNEKRRVERQAIRDKKRGVSYFNYITVNLVLVAFQPDKFCSKLKILLVLQFFVTKRLSFTFISITLP